MATRKNKGRNKATPAKRTSKPNRRRAGTRKPVKRAESPKRDKTQLSKALNEALKLIPANRREAFRKKYKLEKRESISRKRAISIKKKIKLPPVAKSNIIKRKSKSGKTFYYNKRAHKFASAKSWKKSRKRVRASIAKIEKIRKRKPRELTQFNKIQKILSAHAKAKGLKLGKDFNKYAKNIYDGNKNVDPKFIEQNIDQIVDNFSGFREDVPKKKLNFHVSFPFYYAIERLTEAVYDGIKITVSIDDPSNGFYERFEGSNIDFTEWYTTSGTAKHLRKNYNSSPTAMFVLQNTDWKTFADYKIDFLSEGEAPDGMTMPTEPIPAPIEGLPLSSAPIKETAKQKRDRKKGEKAERESATEKYDSKLAKYTKKLRALGISDEDIARIPAIRWENEQKRRGKTQTDFVIDLMESGVKKADVKKRLDELNKRELAKIMQADMKWIDESKAINWSDEKIRNQMLFPLNKK